MKGRFRQHRNYIKTINIGQMMLFILLTVIVVMLIERRRLKKKIAELDRLLTVSHRTLLEEVQRAMLEM